MMSEGLVAIIIALIGVSGSVVAVVKSWRTDQVELALKLIQPLRERIGELETQTKAQATELSVLRAELEALREINMGVRARLELTTARAKLYLDGAWTLYDQVKEKLPNEEPAFYPGVELELTKQTRRKPTAPTTQQ